MDLKIRVSVLALCAAMMGCAAAARGEHVGTVEHFGTGVNQFDIEFVSISGGTNPSSGYGIVDHDYRMGVYEITNDQWNKFKASVGGTVTGNPSSAYDADPYWTGTDVPTNDVSWYEAAQFVNWLNTSRGHEAAYKFTGTPGTSDYTFVAWDSGDDGYDASNPYRNSNAMYFLPTENEWVKAAYWNGNTLQDYATKAGDSLTQGNGTSGTGWNYYDNGYATDPWGPWDVGSGSEELSGTYDMMGNVWEWMESPYSDSNYGASSSRGLRGGSFLFDAGYLQASHRDTYYPAIEHSRIGFRVASAVPEPGCVTALAGIAVMGLIWWRRRR